MLANVRTFMDFSRITKKLFAAVDAFLIICENSEEEGTPLHQKNCQDRLKVIYCSEDALLYLCQSRV